MTDIVLTFGKHRDKKLSQVPTDYVRWLAEQATICGRTDIPQAARAYLASLPPEVANALHYSIPRTAEEAEKLAWMAGKGNKEAARTLLAARNEDGFIPVDFEDADGEEGFFYVYEHGAGGFFAGTQADIDEAKKEAIEDARQEAEREAHPDLEWVAQSGEAIKVWAEFFDGQDQTVTVLFKGQKVEGLVMGVPAKHQAQAKFLNVVALIGTRLGNIGLTAERKAVLDALR
jgi:hypothetical protein